MNPPDHHGQSEAARYAVSSQSAAVRPPEQQFAGPPLMRSCRLLLHCCLPCPSRMHRLRPGVQCHRITPYQPRMHIAKSQRNAADREGKGTGAPASTIHAFFKKRTSEQAGTGCGSAAGSEGAWTPCHPAGNLHQRSCARARHCAYPAEQRSCWTP